MCWLTSCALTGVAASQAGATNVVTNLLRRIFSDSRSCADSALFSERTRQDLCAVMINDDAAETAAVSANHARPLNDGRELHPSAETLDMSDKALVVSFQTVSSWRSSASNSTGGL